MVREKRPCRTGTCSTSPAPEAPKASDTYTDGHASPAANRPLTCTLAPTEPERGVTTIVGAGCFVAAPAAPAKRVTLVAVTTIMTSDLYIAESSRPRTLTPCHHPLAV